MILLFTETHDSSALCCKSRLYPDKFEISHIIHTHSSSCWHYCFSLLNWYFVAQKLFQNIKSPPQDFSQTGEIILLGVGQRAWNTLWGFFGIQYLNDLGQDSFLEVVGVKWAAFGWNATTLSAKDDQLMLRLTMSWWSSGVSGEVGRSWRYCNARPTRDEAGASSWTSSPCKNQFNIEGGTWPPYQILSW